MSCSAAVAAAAAATVGGRLRDGAGCAPQAPARRSRLYRHDPKERQWKAVASSAGGLEDREV